MATLINKNPERRVQYKIDANKTEIMFPNLECLSAALLRDLLPSGSTPAGDSAYITDASDLVPVESLKVNIQPVQSGTGDPSPENVRPISGWDTVKVTRTGKNLFNESNAIVEYDSNRYCKLENGLLHYKNNAEGSFCYTKVFDIYLPSGSYVLSLTNYRLVSGASPIWMIKIGNNPLIYPTANTDYIFTLAEPNTVRIRLTTNGTTLATEFYGNVQLELGSTATAYEPYQGQDYTIPLGRTVYGGTLDVTTGELVVDKVMKRLTTARNLSGTYPGSIIYNVNSPETVDADFKQPIICNRLKYTGNNVANFVYGTCANLNNTSFNLWLKDSAFTDLADATAWLEANETQICYALATPQTYTLTHQQVILLKGINNITANAGTVEVKYGADIHEYINNIKDGIVQDVLDALDYAEGVSY